MKINCQENWENAKKKSHKKSNDRLRCEIKETIMENKKHNFIKLSKTLKFKCISTPEK